MGYDGENATRIVFDVETIPLPDAAGFIEPATAPGQYKDPDKIKAYIKQANADAFGKCSLDPDLCGLAAIGFWPEGEPAFPCVWLVRHPDDEAALLRMFWDQVHNGSHLIGFNCLAFDLPVLFRRSLYLGIDAPDIAIDRFKHPRVTDLMQVLSYNGTLKFRGLDFYKRRFKLDVPDDPHSGKDITRFVAAGDWAAVEQHCRCDVMTTAKLAARLKLFSLELEPAI